MILEILLFRIYLSIANGIESNILAMDNDVVRQARDGEKQEG